MATRPKTFRTARQRAVSEQAERDYDRRRKEESETRRLYGTAAWARVRDDQLAKEPLCRMCMIVAVITPAIICDHVEPHGGDPMKFWHGPFQSLCKSHHDGAKQREEGRLRARMRETARFTAG